MSVLFKEDYSRRKVVIDYTTQNKSFKKIAKMYEKMGIANHSFMLTLYDKDLIGVDPFSETLPVELKAKIAIECKRNYWYYIREIVRVPANGVDGVPFLANRANIAASWMFLNSTHLYLVVPRQICKTITVMVLDGWMMFIKGYNISLGLFASGHPLILENVSRLKTVRDGLPQYLIHKSSKDVDNKIGLIYDTLNTSYKTFTSQKDKRAAANQGRGETFVSGHHDEFVYHYNNDISYPASLSATYTAAEQARSLGIPCANIITTTAGDLDDPRGEYAYSVAQNSMRFTERMFDIPTRAKFKEVVKYNSIIEMVYMDFNHEQLGKDDEWFRKVTAGKTKRDIDKDYRNIWIRGSDTQVLTQEIIDKLKSGEREPRHTTVYKSLLFRWHTSRTELDSEEFKQRKLILALDTSDNVGIDYTTLCLVDPTNLEVVGTCRTNQTNLSYVAQCIIFLMLKYPNFILIPERNKNGAALIDWILAFTRNNKKFNPFRRIYNLAVQHMTEEKYKKIMDKPIDSVDVRKCFGFTTTSSSSSRELLFGDVLSSMMEYGAPRIHDNILIDELIGLSTKNGRIDHADGGHDDMVIAYLLAGYFTLFGENLSYYGISKNKLLANVTVDGEEVDPEYKAKQVKYREERDMLYSKLEHVSNPTLIYDYKKRLAFLESVIDDKDYDIRLMNIEQASENNKINETMSIADKMTRVFG